MERAAADGVTVVRVGQFKGEEARGQGMSMRALRRIIWAAAALLSMLAAAAPAQVRLPEMGASSGAVWTPVEQERLGRELMRSFERQGKLLDDPLATEYLDALGARLVAGADVLDRSFRFFLVDDDSINAFAAPGGYIGVHRGLITAARDEGEVAAVIAHEIAHITQDHLARAYEDAGKMSLPTAVAILGALLLGSADPQVGGAALAGVTAGAAQRQINFTRANEREADRIGIGILADAGFDPQEMPGFFERMQRANRSAGQQLPTLLRTHPVTSERLAEARDLAARLPARQRTLALDFHLVQARLAALAVAQPGTAAVRFAEARGKTRGVLQAAATYGEALARKRLGEIDQARALTAELLAADGDRLAYRLLAAEVEVSAGRWEQALAIYAEAERLFPGSLPLLRGYAEALLASGKADAARALLQPWLRNNDGSVVLYRLAARASGEAGFAAEAHGYQAEAFYLLGHTGEAIRQLEQALGQPDLDLYLRSRLEARRREISDAQKEARGRAG